jgi:hypothetical protein
MLTAAPNLLISW